MNRLRRNESGLTLMELMVAISISAIVVTLVLTSWDYLNRHVFYQENKSSIRDETARIAEEIRQNLRKTPELLRFTQSSVMFLDHNSNDTLEYMFDGENMTKNGAAIPLLSRGIQITSFNVNDLTNNDSEYLLLEITLTAAGPKNIQDTSKFIINVKKSAAPEQKTGWEFGL